jgi:hypothetical protein
MENHCFKQHVRPKIRWEGDGYHDVKVINNYLWEKQAKSRNEWERVIEKAKIS